MSSGRTSPRAVRGAPGAGLNVRDVIWSGGGGSTGRRQVRLPRAVALTDYFAEALHVPSGVYVRGAVSTGHYTRRQMIAMRAILCRLMWQRLAHEVAVAGREAGRAAVQLSHVPEPLAITSGQYRPDQLRKRGLLRDARGRTTRRCS
jgi:hypothetical protein